MDFDRGGYDLLTQRRCLSNRPLQPHQRRYRSPSTPGRRSHRGRDVVTCPALSGGFVLPQHEASLLLSDRPLSFQILPFVAYPYYAEIIEINVRPIATRFITD